MCSMWCFGGIQVVVGASAFTSEFVGSILATDPCERQRSGESRGFSPGAPVSSHRDSWQGGLG
jgi:hypothetical protein